LADFSRLAVTDWRLRRWRVWFLALMTATQICHFITLINDLCMFSDFASKNASYNSARRESSALQKTRGEREGCVRLDGVGVRAVVLAAANHHHSAQVNLSLSTRGKKIRFMWTFKPELL